MYAGMSLVAVVPQPGLLFGLLLLAALTGGYLARMVRIPRVIGYLAGGVVLRTALKFLLDDTQEESLNASARPLIAINDLALGLIMFNIGGVFERSHLRSVGRRVLRIGAAEIALTLGMVTAGCGVCVLLLLDGYPLAAKLALALLLGIAAIETAPAATLFVLREYEAKGPHTDTVISLIGFNNIATVVLFYCAFLALAGTGMITVDGRMAGSPWLALASLTVGSVALGAVLGLLLSIIHAKLAARDGLIFFIATFVALGAGEKWLLAHVGPSFNAMLTVIIAGAVFYNVAIEPPRLDAVLRTIGGPVFAAFFALAGYHMHLEELVHIGWIGGVYCIVRTLGKTAGFHVGWRLAGRPAMVSPRTGRAMLCQASIAIGLAQFVQTFWPSPLGSSFHTIVLGSVALFELLGPILVKRTVVQAGEVKAITLMKTVEPTPGAATVMRLQLQAFLRIFRKERSGSGLHSGQSIKAEHLMRANVSFLPAAASLDDVLHFIERSVHDHFPVADDDGKYIGLIHFSDVREMMYDPAMRQLVTAADLADPAAPFVTVDTPLADLVEAFERANLGVLPVIDATDRRLVGLVEQRDVLRHVSGNRAP